MFLQSAEIQSLIDPLKIITIVAVTITIEVDLVLFTGGDAGKIETLPVYWFVVCGLDCGKIDRYTLPMD